MRKVFIVDDHVFMRETLGALIDAEDGLACCGYAGSIAETMAALPDDVVLVLIDLSLGGDSGLDLVRRLRAERPALHLLVLSAQSAADYRAIAIEAGADGFVEKGNVEEMLATIHRTLDT